jgi:hypothetical protein
MLGYPGMGDRCYMMNEQLSWLTPFSQQVAPGLAWLKFNSLHLKIAANPHKKT